MELLDNHWRKDAFEYLLREEEFKKHGHLDGGWQKLDKLDRGFKEFKRARTLFDFTDMLEGLIMEEDKIPSFKVLIIEQYLLILRFNSFSILLIYISS